MGRKDSGSFFRVSLFVIFSSLLSFHPIHPLIRVHRSALSIFLFYIQSVLIYLLLLMPLLSLSLVSSPRSYPPTIFYPPDRDTLSLLLACSLLPHYIPFSRPILSRYLQSRFSSLPCPYLLRLFALFLHLLGFGSILIS